MNEAVDQVLAMRSRTPAAGRGWKPMLASLTLHGGLVAILLLAPVLADGDRKPLEFVAVTIVPIQALGVPEPTPAPPQPDPRPAPPAEPEAEPPPVEPEKAPEPEPVFSERPAAKPKAAEAREKARPAAPAPGPRQRQGSPEGSPTGTSAFGTTAVTGVDNPDFVYGYYIDQMASLIGSHWVRPPVGKGVEAVLYFRIARSGEISELEIVTSSGHSSFDVAGLRAVRQANPLPPLPNSFRGDSLGVNLVLR